MYTAIESSRCNTASATGWCLPSTAGNNGYPHYADYSASKGGVIALEEIAAAVLYLASDESSFVTGTALVVDGGGVAG